MIRKFLIPAMVIILLAVCGCSQDLPTPPKTHGATVETENPAPKVEVETTQTQPEIPPEIPAPEKPKAESEPPKVVSPVVQDKTRKLKVKVYYPDDAGINLVAVNRTIEIHSDAEKYSAAVNLLTTSPTEKDLTVIFPKNAKVRNVNFENGTAFVDFDKNITKSFAGGSTGEELLVGSVVKTLTEFPEVKQVRFLIDGQEIETLSGHMDLSEPVKKTDL